MKPTNDQARLQNRKEWPRASVSEPAPGVKETVTDYGPLATRRREFDSAKAPDKSAAVVARAMRPEPGEGARSLHALADEIRRMLESRDYFTDQIGRLQDLFIDVKLAVDLLAAGEADAAVSASLKIGRDLALLDVDSSQRVDMQAWRDTVEGRRKPRRRDEHWNVVKDALAANPKLSPRAALRIYEKAGGESPWDYFRRHFSRLKKSGP